MIQCCFPACSTAPWWSAPPSPGSTDAAYHSAENRRLCAVEGILPLIRERGELHGSGLGAVRCVVEHASAWLLANKRLDRRTDRSTSVIDGLLTTACIFVIANRLTD